MPRKKNPRPCACGCGKITKGGQWVSGHDSEYMSRVHEEIRKTFPDVQNVTLFIGEAVLERCAGRRADLRVGDSDG